MSDDIETLRAKHDAAVTARRTVERAKNEAISAAREEIGASYLPREDAAWAAETAAKQALDEAIVAGEAACDECLELLMSAAKAWRNAAKKVSTSNKGSKEGLACNTAYTEAQLKLADVIDAITIKDKLPRREDEPDRTAGERG